VLMKQGLSSLLYDLRFLAIFCDKPLVIGSEGSDQTVVAGDPSLGGISRTVLERSVVECRLDCGRCCKNFTIPLLSWFWFGFEPHPPGYGEEELYINGRSQIIHLFHNEGTRCVQLDDTDRCKLHMSGLKPTHCLISPPAGLWHRGGRDVISCQALGRNWRWPKCPVDWPSTPYDDETRDRWLQALKVWRRALEGIPGNRMNELYDPLVKLFDNPSSFYDLSEGRAILRLEELL